MTPTSVIALDPGPDRARRGRGFFPAARKAAVAVSSISAVLLLGIRLKAADIAVDAAGQPLRFGAVDVSFTAGVRYRLTYDADLTCGGQHILYGSTDRRKGQPLVERHFVGLEICMMYLNPFRAHPTQPGIPGNRDVYGSRACGGNPICRQGSGVRKRSILWTVISLGPEHGLPILRESTRRKVRDSVDSASGPLQPPALREARED